MSRFERYNHYEMPHAQPPLLCVESSGWRPIGRQSIFLNSGGEPMTKHAEIAEMAAGFMADFPDLVLHCDTVLVADHHMVYAWTFEGHHSETGKFIRFSGWEEWDLDDDLKVTKSLGWYDAEDFNRQVASQA